MIIHAGLTLLQTNRLPLDIMRHTVKRKTHRNDRESDERLAKAVEFYGSDNWQLGLPSITTNASCTYTHSGETDI